MQYYKKDRLAVHLLRGMRGEDLAAAYLQERGYEIQHRNWRTGFYEIDIIATRERKIHFVEVKTRHSLAFGHPEEQVTRKKFRNLQKAAERYLEFYPFWSTTRIQYDILAITCLPGKPVEFFLSEDVYG